MNKGDYDKGRGLLALRGNTKSLQASLFVCLFVFVSRGKFLTPLSTEMFSVPSQAVTLKVCLWFCKCNI